MDNIARIPLGRLPMLRRKSPHPGLPACDEALLRILKSPLNDPMQVEAAQARLRTMKAPVCAAAFDGSHRLPALTWLFDADFYVSSNPDVAAEDIEPYIHFLHYGLKEQRNPHPLVDLGHVFAQLYQDHGDDALSEARLAEVLRAGRIDPHPLFDCAFYLEHNPDVAEAGLAPLEHFVRHGAEEGRAPNPSFDADWYLANYPDAVPSGNRYDAFVHFASVGAAQGFRPGPGSEAGEGQVLRGRTAPGGKRPPVEGVLDAVREHVAHGWTWAPREPGRRLEVEIVEGDRVVGRGIADHFRQDLKKGGIGDGKHAFAIRLSHKLLDGGRHHLVARLRDSGAGVLHGRIEKDFPAADPPPFDQLPVDMVDTGSSAGIAEGDRAEFARALEDANLRIEAGEYQLALDSLEPLMERWPQSGLVAVKAGEAWLGLGRPDRALEAFRRATEVVDAFAEWAWLGLGNAQRMLGQWRHAGESYARGLESAPDSTRLRDRLLDVRIWEQLVEARRKMGDGQPDAALTLLGPLLLQRPDGSQVRDAIHEAFELRRREEGAVAGDLDASMERARRELDLLQLVVEHVARRAGQAP